jgi:hypothetical protein
MMAVRHPTFYCAGSVYRPRSSDVQERKARALREGILHVRRMEMETGGSRLPTPAGDDQPSCLFAGPMAVWSKIAMAQR